MVRVTSRLSAFESSVSLVEAGINELAWRGPCLPRRGRKVMVGIAIKANLLGAAAAVAVPPGRGPTGRMKSAQSDTISNPIGSSGV
jgi:hypothetical protein